MFQTNSANKKQEENWPSLLKPGQKISGQVTMFHHRNLDIYVYIYIYIYVCTVHILQVCSNHIGCFLKWWVFPPLKHPKCWSFVGKPHGFVGVPPHHFRSCAHMGVSENSGTPKIIHFNRLFHDFHHPFWGKPHHFWKHPYKFQPPLEVVTWHPPGLETSSGDPSVSPLGRKLPHRKHRSRWLSTSGGKISKLGDESCWR